MKEHFSTDILILGAGIGGYETFRTLSTLLKKKEIKKKITIVDKHSYFTFVPMMHEVATGSIEPTHAAIPLRELVAGTPHTFIKADILDVDAKKRVAHTSAGDISFDTCVIAMGSVTNYFGTPGADAHSYHVRTLSGALALKHDFLNLLESRPTDTIQMTIVGGGYTGVEVAGQYCDFIKTDLKKLYPDAKIQLRIIQSGDCILSYMKPEIQHRVTERLRRAGVEIHANAHVSAVSDTQVTLADGRTLGSDITIWTAGFKNIGPVCVDESYCTNGRINVNAYLRMEAFEYLYAVGDIANSTDPTTNITYPQLAEAAHLQGRYVAHAIVDTLQGKQQKPFVFKSKGQLMPVGDWWGVAQIGPITLYGKLAWWIRRTVYVLFMPGFLRKLRIVFDWTIHSFGYRDIITIDDGEREQVA